MSKLAPCYRVCLWDARRKEWAPVITRTRNLLKTLRMVKRYGYKRGEVWVETRPGKGIEMPLPTAKGSQLKLVR